MSAGSVLVVGVPYWFNGKAETVRLELLADADGQPLGTLVRFLRSCGMPARAETLTHKASIAAARSEFVLVTRRALAARAAVFADYPEGADAKARPHIADLFRELEEAERAQLAILRSLEQLERQAMGGAP